MPDASLALFVRAARDGIVPAGVGGADPQTGGLADGTARLAARDAEAIAAEAYNQGIVEPEAPWASTLAAVQRLLEEKA